MNSIYEFEAKSIDGRIVALEEFRGQTLLIVNVASRCALTPQYASLEKLYQKLHPEGFSILGFPLRPIRTPGNLATKRRSRNSAHSRYNVTFPMFAKVEVNGPNSHPLFQFLEEKAPGWFGNQRIHWNFTKFLIDRNGVPIKRFGPGVPPSLLESAIVETFNVSVLDIDVTLVDTHTPHEWIAKTVHAEDRVFSTGECHCRRPVRWRGRPRPVDPFLATRTLYRRLHPP